MESYFKIFKNNALFNNIDSKDYEKLFNFLEGTSQFFLKNDIILLIGDEFKAIGIVISGSVKILKEDIDGNQYLVTEISEGDMFGEVFACAEISESPVSIIASQKSEILFLNYSKIKNKTEKNEFSVKLTENMLKIIVEKNLYLNHKIEILSKKTLREKLKYYLKTESKGRKKFTIPFNREQLANYINGDRSAVSNELSKMQAEKIIKYNKNEFEIYF